MFVDHERLRAELVQLCARAAGRCHEIEEVFLFGSQTRDQAGPRSDADLLVVLKQSAHRRRMDRIPSLIEAFSPAPVPLDIVPWTRDELDRARASGDPWLTRILSAAVRLWPITGAT